MDETILTWAFRAFGLSKKESVGLLCNIQMMRNVSRISEVEFSHLIRCANAHAAGTLLVAVSGRGTSDASSQPVTKCDFKA